jgi:hypothetical protein
MEGFQMSDTVIRLATSKDSEQKSQCAELSPSERAERNAHYARAYLELECELRDAERMARIAAERLQETFGRPPSLNDAEPDHWYVPEGQAEVDVFAVTHVLDMLVALLQKYDAAFDQTKA